MIHNDAGIGHHLCFVKGRMSAGYTILMDREDSKIDFTHAPKGMKTPKMVNMSKISGRKSWIIQERTIPSIFKGMLTSTNLKV